MTKLGLGFCSPLDPIQVSFVLSPMFDLGELASFSYQSPVLVCPIGFRE